MAGNEEEEDQEKVKEVIKLWHSVVCSECAF